MRKARLPEPPEPDHLYVCGDELFRGRDAGVQPIPDDMRVPGVKGVYVGGCVARGLGSIGGLAYAHAHLRPRDSWRGWVCFQHPNDMKRKSARMHELAHILTGEGHTRRWRETMHYLGQPVPPKYRQGTTVQQSCT